MKLVQLFPWLCYSPNLDGGFCLPLVLFGDKCGTKSKIKYWPDAKACYTRHQKMKSGLHSDASTIYSSFLSSHWKVSVDAS